MTEHTLTIVHDAGALLHRAECSCGLWARPIEPGASGKTMVALAHAEHVQAEADWDAIAAAISWVRAPFSGRIAREALARLRGRPTMSDEPEFLCDITHGWADKPKADWAWIGEAGDYFLCDFHFQKIADPGPNWQPIP